MDLITREKFNKHFNPYDETSQIGKFTPGRQKLYLLSMALSEVAGFFTETPIILYPLRIAANGCSTYFWTRKDGYAYAGAGLGLLAASIVLIKEIASPLLTGTSKSY